MDGCGNELVLTAERRPVHLLEQAFLAAERQFLRLDLHDVPVGIAALDLGAQRADAAVPTVVHHLGTGLLGERREVDLALSVLIVAAPGGDRQVTGFGACDRRTQQCGAQEKVGLPAHRSSPCRVFMIN